MYLYKQVIHIVSKGDGMQFWGSCFGKVFVDVRIFNPNAESYRNYTPQSCLCRLEQDKRRQYDQRIRELQHASFSPLVFSTSGGMGKSVTSIAYKGLARVLSLKRDESYVIRWLRCRLGSDLVRA